MNSDDYAFQAGQTIPGHHWIVVAPIGAGGMGEVYEVRGAHIDRRYVLKTLLKELRGDEMAVKRFFAEAQFLGRMNDEKIVNILATGVTFDEHQQPFFVMEKVYGSTLNVLLKVATKLDLAYACDVFAQIAHALHIVHENGVIHGDVKPLNIMFQKGVAGLESVKLLDFGIARKREATATGDLSARMGTPRYTPPEQARWEKLTPAADIYALFVILYEAVTQQYPWPHATTDEAQMSAHIHVPPQPLESHGVYPARLCELVRRSLLKNPLERPQTMAFVESELKAIADEIRGLQPKSLADTPTVKRLLTGVQEPGRDDAAPSSSRHRTEESGPPAARAYRANGTSNGMASELLVGDEGATQDLEPAGPKPAPPAEAPPRQRTVRMVLPVHHSPIVVVGADPQGPVPPASPSPAPPPQAVPPAHAWSPPPAPPAVTTERPPMVLARPPIALPSIVQTSVPEPLDVHGSPPWGNTAPRPEEPAVPANRPAPPPAAAVRGHADVNVIAVAPYANEPMHSVKRTEPMAVVVANADRVSRASAAAAFAATARAEPSPRAHAPTAFAEALRSTSRSAPNVDVHELPTPPGVVTAMPTGSPEPEPAAAESAAEHIRPRRAARRSLSAYAAQIIFVLIVGSGVLGAMAIVRKPPTERLTPPATQDPSPPAVAPAAQPAAPVAEPQPEATPVPPSSDPAPNGMPFPTPSAAPSASEAVARSTPTPRRSAPAAAPSAPPKRARPSSGLDWMPAEFAPQAEAPSKTPPRETKTAAAPRASASSAAPELDALWEVRTPTPNTSKKK